MPEQFGSISVLTPGPVTHQWFADFKWDGENWIWPTVDNAAPRPENETRHDDPRSLGALEGARVQYRLSRQASFSEPLSRRTLLPLA